VSRNGALVPRTAQHAGYFPAADAVPYNPAMTAVARVRALARAIRRALRPLRPQSYWQVWLAVGSLPLAALVVGMGLKLIFHRWPQFDVPSAIGTVGSCTLAGSRQSLALRRRRRAERSELA
jgi:hypothetical protein